MSVEGEVREGTERARLRGRVSSSKSAKDSGGQGAENSDIGEICDGSVTASSGVPSMTVEGEEEKAT